MKKRDDKILFLKRIIKKQNQIIKQQDKQIEKLQTTICKIEKRLLLYENAHTPPGLKKKKKILLKIPSGKLGAPQGYPKYEREEPEITHSKTYTAQICPRCSAPLGTPDLTKRIIEEEIPKPKPLEVTEHLINCYHCNNCGKEIVSKNDAPEGNFGKNAVTQITLLKHEDRLPLRKVSNSLNRHYNLKITHVGIMKIIIRVAKKLKKSYYEIIMQIRLARVIYVDETQYKLNGET